MSDPNQLLWKAIKKGSLSKAQGALDQGADPNTVKNGMTPLLYAVWEKHTEIVKLLCEKGANVNYQHPDTRDSALIMAVAGGDLEIVRTLCSFGADKMLQTVDGKTAFDFVDEDSNTFSQIETILETCGISDPNLLNRDAAIFPAQNAVNDPTLLQPSENTDPQGGKRRTRKTRRRKLTKRRKSNNRSRRG